MKLGWIADKKKLQGSKKSIPETKTFLGFGFAADFSGEQPKLKKESKVLIAEEKK